MHISRVSAVTLMMFATATTGCVAPVARRGDATMPAEFSAQADVGLHATQAVAAQWWRSFGSDELDRLETTGLNDSLDLRGAQARVVQARALTSIAGAARYPTVDLLGNRDSRTSGPYVSDSSLAFVASYEIDFWGRNAARADAARSREAAAEYDARTVAITLAASIANTYFQATGLKQRLALARQLAADARRVLRLVEIQQEIGTGAELQTDLQRNEVATFDESAAALEQQLEQQQHQLAVLVGRAPEGFDTTARDAAEAVIPTITADTPAALLSRRPDIAASEAQLQAAQLDLKVSRTALLPSVSLAGALGTLIAPTNALHVIGANLSQPVFHGKALRGQVRYDEARITELEAAFRSTVLVALQDVEDQLTVQTRVAQAEQAATEAVASARRAAFLSEAQFKLGVSDYLSVLTAERAQFQAEDLRLQLHVVRQQAAVNLIRALGGGFDARTVP